MEKIESITNKVLKNSSWSFILSIINKLGGLLFTIVLARFLLPEKFGAYSLILAYSVLFMSFGDLGINQTLMTFFSKELKNEKVARAYYKFLLKIKLLVVLFLAIVFILVSYFLVSRSVIIPNISPLILICSIYIFFFSITSFYSSFFYIYSKVKLDLIKETLFQTIRLVFVLGIFMLFDAKYYLIGVFSTLSICSMIIFFFVFSSSKKLAPFLMKREELVTIDKSRILKFMIYLILGSISLIVFSEVDILMLGFLVKDLSYVGYYRAYFVLVIGIASLVSISPILLPIFSSFDKERVSLAFTKVIKYSLILNIPACFGILVLGRYFTTLFYGSEYLVGSLALYFLSFLIITETFTNNLSMLFSAREKPKFIAYSLIIATIMNVIFSYIFIIFLMKYSFVWAISGAAIATLISRFFFMSVLVFYSKKEFNLKIPANLIIKPFVSSIIMALFLFGYIRLVGDMNLFLGFISVVIGIITYFGVMFLIKGFTYEDIAIFSIFWKKKNPKGIYSI